ncbi:HU family DNA-binding protein [Methylobacterium radiotolerans]|jgi:nucleoid DNA-binding protein|uniref:HU family DNA-binding protein n=1 Tax=Methylobacterium TaxID=407 RepID=UPI0005DD00F4|nr:MULTISPECIES: HU family DNA-binding protein [Methylobacterium]MBN6821738.1 HU family DNA-binding protein [Methylobacterium organophilum]MCY4498191.1 HU family DNA-binding protein [Rhodospirillaceae bacterium]OXE40271.1 HU family DNA-binding protein [Methylobacterium radiotolerans]GAN49688.1 DNA-binding protein HU-beta [Methylobacterium sp. ME121]
MTKNELVAHLAEKSTLKKSQVGAVVEALSDLIHVELRSGRDVIIPDVGRLSVKAVAERRGKSPATGQPYVKPAHKAAKFKPAKALADVVA